jgi:8-oxo-dGTP pyrophosphatase MutT (NUDIX family)
MYKVFFNDRRIYLDDTLPDMSEVGGDYVCAFENITDLRPQVRQFLEPDKKGNLYIFHEDKEALLRTFSQCFRFIMAAGGLVKNAKGEMMVIFRRGRWDLPKGKADKGESPGETALREVQEECGLEGLIITGFLQTTYHIYLLHDKHVLKQTDWFSMEYRGKKKAVPNTAEDITEVRWIKPAGAGEILQNTYPSIQEVLSGSL